jgi:hypothetical protein
LHIHLDARDLTEADVKNKGRSFGKTLDVLWSLIPESRRENTYCKKAVSPLSKGERGDRYYAINLTAFQKYQTIEIRCHSSTTDFKKIKHWIVLMRAIYSTSIKKKCVNLDDLFEVVSLPEDSMEYLAQREALFRNSEASNDARDLDEVTIPTSA